MFIKISRSIITLLILLTTLCTTTALAENQYINIIKVQWALVTNNT